MELLGCELDGKNWSTADASILTNFLPHTLNEAKTVGLLIPTLLLSLWLLGCAGDDMVLLSIGCSLPLGMESGEIKNTQITASSTKTSWFNTWDASLARLNQKGKMNAWRAKVTREKQGMQQGQLVNKFVLPLWSWCFLHALSNAKWDRVTSQPSFGKNTTQFFSRELIKLLATAVKLYFERWMVSSGPQAAELPCGNSPFNFRRWVQLEYLSRGG